MKNILIIGIGRLGRHLAEKLTELNNSVMIVDKDENIINELAPRFTNAMIGDCTKEGVLRSLGVNNFDICFVTISDNFQSSLEITSLLKELGAKYVVSKANRDLQAKFLLRNGADEVVYPERDIAEKLAIRHNAKIFSISSRLRTISPSLKYLYSKMDGQKHKRNRRPQNLPHKRAGNKKGRQRKGAARSQLCLRRKRPHNRHRQTRRRFQAYESHVKRQYFA